MVIKGKHFLVAGALAALLLALWPWDAGKNGFPDRAAVSAMGQEAAEAALLGRERQEILRAWGEPDGMLSGFFGDVYHLDGASRVIVYYDTEPMNNGTASSDTVPVEQVRLMEE